EGGQDRPDGAAREVARQHDAVVDLDVVVVGGDIEGAGRVEREAAAEVQRILGLEVGRAQGARHRAVHREGADLDRYRALAGDVDEVRADRGEMRLGEGRRTEAGAGRAT